MRILISTLALLSATAVQAQDWEYTATLYGWLPGVTGTLETQFGTLELEPDDGDGDSIFGLQAGFLGSFVAHNGRWGMAADVLYADLGASQDTPFGLLYSDAAVEQKLTAISGYALYRVADNPSAVFDLGAGFRYFDATFGVDLGAGTLPAVSQSISADWTDAVVVAKLLVPMGDRWFLNGLADWGGDGSGSQTWQAYAGVGFRFNDAWSTQIGYRHMELTKEIDGFAADLALDGGVVAVSYNF